MTSQNLTQRPWIDDPRQGKYIDDNALYVFWCVINDFFTIKHDDLSSRLNINFIFLSPPEWEHSILVQFLTQIAQEYKIEPSCPQIMMEIIRDIYEQPLWDTDGKILKGYEKEVEKYFEAKTKYDNYLKKNKIDPFQIPINQEAWRRRPKTPVIYRGAYKWALDYIEKNPDDTDAQCLSNFFQDKATFTDLLHALKVSFAYIANGLPANDERKLKKEIYTEIVNYVTFEISSNKQLQKDLKDYLDLFIEDSLSKNQSSKLLGNKLVKNSPNLLIFARQKEILLNEIKTKEADYGKKFIFENEIYDTNPIDINDSDSIEARYKNKEYLFVHTLLAFEKLGYLKIRFLGNNWHHDEEQPPRFRTEIELLPEIYPLLGKDTQQLSNLFFDPDKSRLYIRGVEIKIQKFKDQYHTLNTILNSPDEDIGQEWFYSDIAERLDASETIDTDTKYYNASYQIHKKAEQKGFPDFFIKTSQSVKINPKYLP